jgi:hypothetical protein
MLRPFSDKEIPMRRMLFCLWPLFLIAALVGCGQKSSDSATPATANKNGAGSTSQGTTSKGLAAVAKEVLTLYQQKDFVRMASLSIVPPPAGILEQLKPGGELYKEMTDENDPTWQRVRAFQGELGEVRVEHVVGFVVGQRLRDTGGGKAEAPHPPTDPADGSAELICVTAVREVDGWKFNGVFFPEPDDFQEWGEVESDSSGAETKTASQEARIVVEEFLAAVKADDLARAQKTASKYALEDLADVRLPTGSSDESQLDSMKLDAMTLFSKQDLAGWDGKIHETRHQKNARAKFGQDGNESFVLELSHKDGHWKLKDFASPDTADFEQWGIPYRVD